MKSNKGVLVWFFSLLMVALFFRTAFGRRGKVLTRLEGVKKDEVSLKIEVC